MKDNKSPGPDEDFSGRKNYLLLIYNNIWIYDNYPEQWGLVTTIPLLKHNKNKTKPNNYRPISMSNCLSKIMQKMVNKRLMWHLESNHILHNIQCGFRGGRSATDPIVNLETEVHKAFKNKQNLIAVFFDLKKAYDMVWKYHVLKLMKDLGLNGNILQYTNNFLMNRRFQVSCNGCLSTEMKQENGLPQGEILSVTLFLIAINKIANHIKLPVKASLFADDLLIYCTSKNIQNIKTNLQNTISELEKWCDNTGFQFSSSKTKALHFNRKQYSNYNPKLKINGNYIEYVKEMTFLGVVFDKKLTWESHIKHLKTDFLQRLNILKTLGHGEHKEKRYY